MRVWKKSEQSFKVESEKTEGKFYRVRIVGTLSVCSCPHFTNRHTIDECKHIERVKEAIYNDDYIDETNIGKLRAELTSLIKQAYDIDNRIRNLEEGFIPSSGF